MTKTKNTAAAVEASVELNPTRGYMNMQAALEALQERLDQGAGAPTPASIVEHISQAVSAVGAAFDEQVPRIRGDNGKLYPITDNSGAALNLPDEVEPVAYECVNELAFLQRGLASAIPWKLEMMLQSNRQSVTDAKRQLAWARKAADNGEVDSWVPESKSRWVDQLEYQGVLLETALGAAMEAYEATVGEAFLTQAEREAARIRSAAGRAKGTERNVSTSKAAAFRASA